MESGFEVTSVITPSQLYYALTPEELLQLIIEIDERVGDWDFTMNLLAYFRQQEDIFQLEQNEDPDQLTIDKE